MRFAAFNLQINALRLDADRQAMLARKQRKTDAKNKYKQMQKLDMHHIFLSHLKG